jgi:hypothetical protein
LQQAGQADRVPPYVTRDFDSDLRDALQRDSFTLLVGESTAGKTRAAFEAMRLLLGNFMFVAPSSRGALPSLVSRLNELGDHVVWLDDLERFLGPDGLTPSVLHSMLAPRVRTVVLATMRSHEYDHYRDRLEAELTGAERDSWREGRTVLRQAQVIHVNRRWTAQETMRAQAHVSDRRLARAIANADRYGIAETLAAGPELAEAWRHAWTPGHHPRAAALVAAAVDARKAGYHRPLPRTVLEQMHEAYLAERGGPILRPESIQEAFQWALAPTFPGAANSLLADSPSDGYLAFDYLIDLPGFEGMPDESWDVLIGHITGYDAYLIADLALLDGRHDRAVRGLLRAADTGAPVADAVLVELGAAVRPAHEALERGQRHFLQQRDELGPDNPQVLQAEHFVVILNMQAGRYALAITQATDLIVRAERILGPGHRTVLGLKWNIGWSTFKLGKYNEGIRILNAAIADSREALGNSDLATASRRIEMVRALYESGQIDSARELLTELKDNYSDFRPDHIISMDLKSASDYIGADTNG